MNIRCPRGKWQNTYWMHLHFIKEKIILFSFKGWTIWLYVTQWHIGLISLCVTIAWGLFQYYTRCPIERARNVSKACVRWWWYSNGSEIWHAVRLKQFEQFNTQFQGYEALWNIMISRLIWYWKDIKPLFSLRNKVFLSSIDLKKYMSYDPFCAYLTISDYQAKFYYKWHWNYAGFITGK